MDTPTGDDFGQMEAAPHSELVVLIARGVGVVVAIVAVFSSIIIMMLLRYIIALLINRWGSSGVFGLIVSFIYAALKINSVPMKTYWTIISRSCV